MSSLRIAYPRGVMPGKWARVWAARHPEAPLELTLGRAVTDASAQTAPLRAGAADGVFVRLPLGDGVGDEGVRLDPEVLHLVPLYEEQPFALAAEGHLIEAADEVRLAELDGEARHPFDDDVETWVQVVAAGAGVLVVPQSVARLYARRDVVARPVLDAPGWRVGFAWLRETPAEVRELVDDFVGVLRGRTAGSSRGAAGPTEAAEKGAAAKAGGGRRGATGAEPPRGKSPRGARSRRRPTR